MQETWVPSLGQEDPLEEGLATHSSSCLENAVDRGGWQDTVHGVTKTQTTLSNEHFQFHVLVIPPCSFPFVA